MKDAALYLLHAIACGLHGVPALPLPSTATWDEVHTLAKANSVESMAWAGVRSRAAELPDDLRKAWEDEANATLWRRLQFDAERERVLAQLAEAGFSYLPLKGILMAGYYPDPGMRSMADNDILYGFVEPCSTGGYQVQGTTPAAREQTIARATREVARLMTGMGYEVKVLSRGNADAFQKAPCFNFEMHRILLPPEQDPCGHFENPWAHAIADAPGAPSYHFSASEEYVFHLAHAHKHVVGCGCGVRNAVDEFVFLQARESELDREYVHRVLGELALTDFEHLLRRAAYEAFGDAAPAGRQAGAAGIAGAALRDAVAVPDADTDSGTHPGERDSLDGARAMAARLSPESAELLLHMIGAGTYGNLPQQVTNKLDRSVEQGKSPLAAKLAYLKSRLRPSDDTLRLYSPFFARHRALIPLLVVGRVVKAAVRAPKTLRELKMLGGYKRH